MKTARSCHVTATHTDFPSGDGAKPDHAMIMVRDEVTEHQSTPEPNTLHTLHRACSPFLLAKMTRTQHPATAAPARMAIADRTKHSISPSLPGDAK
eukprot:CAMPEP_0169444854 /NCGR_PEP_ID=MMETSP1042-20121227/10124_1 /TAXON_ID=464988 /ORGANISM="Hemiselmis andersenii, Strain CCMP1180" /LENGTH=95 /DNA_ID=CAMNT_0009556203 /DNA_START=242 /DNA_END=529 /DNA_ORIENTATION=-